MKKGTIFIWVLVILIILILIAIFRKKPTSPAGNGGGYQGGGNNNGNGGSGGIQNTEPQPQTPPIILPTSAGKLDDHKGEAVIALVDNTKVYFNNPLSVAKTYKAGQFIGRLGSEETDNLMCPNRKGYYRILDTGIMQKHPIFGVYTPPPCDVIMPDTVLKQIFKVS